jgi:hypothetical protein
MKRMIVAGTAALAVLLSGQALAQSAVEVELAPEQKARMKEYVVKEQIAPAQVRERVTVGAVLPADVELRTAPSDWGPCCARYRYVYAENRVVLVEPSTRQVVRIVD